ncbi:hypothetical protein AZZ77_004874, partial [Klebsiella pneumoniae]
DGEAVAGYALFRASLAVLYLSLIHI